MITNKVLGVGLLFFISSYMSLAKWLTSLDFTAVPVTCVYKFYIVSQNVYKDFNLNCIGSLWLINSGLKKAHPKPTK